MPDCVAASRREILAGVSASALTLCTFTNSGAQTAKSIWPKVRPAIAASVDMEAKITALMARMNVFQKVGQMVQPEIKNISPDDAAKYHIGSVLSGGGSWPTGEVDGPLAGWLSLANMFYGASMDTGDSRLAIPILWGTDAVHGHNNVMGATIFPHNIGLGAANNPGLMRDIGTVTAREVAVTGIDWTFAPAVSVAKDSRWGRTYESFSSDPKVVANLAKEFVLGLQGHPALGNFLSQQKVIGTAKHFIGDGGTTMGIDQGDAEVSEEELYKNHGQGYVQTIGAGVQTVMASFSSWNGEKLHGHKYLLTDVLKIQMGFDGFVIGDWNGHEQVKTCSASSCSNAINAGVDMIMVPEAWKAFLDNTIRQVKAGVIPMARIDDAVRRILRVKFRSGMFDDGKPTAHELAGRAKLIGHADHRALARQAVRESLVLLKNEAALPLSPDSSVIVTGPGADNPNMQAGGWTLDWQGRDVNSKYYKGFTTVKAAFERSDFTVMRDEAARADAAIFVFGETPYAEMDGGLDSLDFDVDLSAIKAFKLRGMKVISIYLGGRPRGLDAVIDMSDAFIAAWLPGSEGGVGLVDVMGGQAYDFKGRLPFDWPHSSDSNFGEGAPRHARGYGLSYAKIAP